MAPSRQASDDVGAISMSVDDTGFQLCDQRADGAIFVQVTSRADNNPRDWDVKRLEPGDEWMVVFGAWLENRGNVHPITHLHRRHHRHYTLESTLTRWSKNVEHFRTLTHALNG